MEGESSAELDSSSIPPLVVEGKILVLASFKFFIMISRYKSQVTQRIELCSPATAPEKTLMSIEVGKSVGVSEAVGLRLVPRRCLSALGAA